MVLVNHPPKVVGSGFEDRSLRCNRFFVCDINEVGIDIVVDIMLVLRFAESDSCGLESQVVWVAIEFKLFRMVVEFSDMKLCLRHEGDKFEFDGGRSVNSLEFEIHGSDLLPEHI